MSYGLPWEIGINGSVVTQTPDENTPICAGVVLQFYGGHVICESVTDANAEFIVRACNSHDTLVEAAEATLDALNELIGADYDLSGEQVLLKAALKKVRGESDDG